VLVGRLPPERQHAARLGGLALAMATRIALLFSIVWLTHLRQPWFGLAGRPFSARDLVLLAGGLFLLGKSVLEIHYSL
jgi:predicted tellurium resistance membrane protein TerC